MRDLRGGVPGRGGHRGGAARGAGDHPGFAPARPGYAALNSVSVGAIKVFEAR